MAERLQAKPSAAAMMIFHYAFFFKFVLIVECYMDLIQ